MSSKLVFFDIDGTLWDWNGDIPDSTIVAIKKLKENGHIPILCSGRSKGHIVEPKLLDMGFAGIIAACGEHVEYEGQIIDEQFLEADLVKKIIDLSEECNVPIVLEGPVKQWISAHGFELDDFVTRMYEVMGDNAVTLHGYTEDMKVNKFAGDVLKDSDYKKFKAEIEKDLSFIEHEFVCEVKEIADSKEISMVFEAVIPGTSKEKGIKKLCDYLKVDMKDTYALGDSANDIEMIKCVGTGIAMGNGSNSLKEVSDYVTDHIHKDGLYNALKHFELI